MSTESEYTKLVGYVSGKYSAVEGLMFGKKCIKIGGKVGVVLLEDAIVFKLPAPALKNALALDGSINWDPSGRGRPMKEWAVVKADHAAKYEEFADAAAGYVG